MKNEPFESVLYCNIYYAKTQAFGKGDCGKAPKYSVAIIKKANLAVGYGVSCDYILGLTDHSEPGPGWLGAAALSRSLARLVNEG